MTQLRPLALFLVTTIGSSAACAIDTVPVGLRATPPGPGARVVYEPLRRPLPEIPLPNDTATFPDPTSRTGRRINVSTFAPTGMERAAREGFDSMEGWGTYSPISVAFQKSELGDPRAPALDLDEVRRRMPRGDFDFADDPVYVINLKTGVPVVLDMGSGAFPYTLRDPWRYWAHDPAKNESNLFFETREEGAGLTQADYRPELDTDFDGVLDHPNTYGAGVRDGYDNLLTWYERETDSLLLRPLIPMDEKTEYAVVLTDRLRGSDAHPVRSAFDSIHHPAQRDSVARVRDVLSDAGRANYYGDLAGTGLDHVAFAWSFTTQPTQEDLLLLRDGLYGKGPFARFEKEYAPHAVPWKLAGRTGGDEGSAASCKGPMKAPYIMNLADPEIAATFVDTVSKLANLSGPELEELKTAMARIDHLVIGTFQSPQLQGPANARDPDSHFHVNFKTGEGDVRGQDVRFWLWVPKAENGHHAPFPVTILSHGHGGNADASFAFAGDFARQGLATLTIDLPGHGMVVAPTLTTILSGVLANTCYAGLAKGIISGRAEDVDGDGVGDSGAWFWTSHLFHVRDNVRQSILDLMQTTRLVRSFDGTNLGSVDMNGDGKMELAGDFDGDGVVDLDRDQISASGGSLGGIVAMIQGAVDPFVRTTSAIVGAGGLTDVSGRTTDVSVATMQQVFSPLVVALPVAGTNPVVLGVGDDFLNDDPGSGAPGLNGKTRCKDGQRSVRYIVNDGGASRHLEIACLTGAELGPNKTVVVTNVATKESRCAGTGEGGRFRVPLPATTGDRVDIQVYDTPHAVASYGTCAVRAEAVVGRRIQTFEQRAVTYTFVASPDVSCPSDDGCAQFIDRLFPVGSPLVAPQDGLGLRRQSPNYRRFLALGQAVLDPGDPINYAPYYAIRTLPDLDGVPMPPKPVLSMPSVGDELVPVAAELAFGRAAGLMPFLPPSAGTKFPEYLPYVMPPALYQTFGNRTAHQVLVDGFEIEGIPRLRRTPAGSACGAPVAPRCTYNYTESTCAEALYDADWMDEGALPFNQQHPSQPLRMVRRVDVPITDMASLDAAWQPRIVGVPLGAVGWSGGGKLASAVAVYSIPEGTHAPTNTCTNYAAVLYEAGLLARFTMTDGADILFATHPESHTCLGNRSCAFITH